MLPLIIVSLLCPSAGKVLRADKLKNHYKKENMRPVCRLRVIKECTYCRGETNLLNCLRNLDMMAELTVVSMATVKKQAGICSSHIVFLTLWVTVVYMEVQ